MPAQFFDVEIYVKETEKIVEISTGSGSLIDFWQTFEMIANNMLSIDNIEMVQVIE